jgi:hypothetical protein
MNIEKIREIADGNTGTDVGTLWALLDECADEIELLRSLNIPIHSESELEDARLRDLLQSRDAEIIELKGRVPKVFKVVMERDAIGPIWKCECKIYVNGYVRWKYCPNCGVKFDWSDV